MIRFDHITKQYPGTNRPALNSIDLEILRGEFVFLVGASGSGKSSCLRLVLKEEKPTSGSIHVLGQDLRSISNRKVPYFRRNLGVVFQDFRLLPNKSVYDNVAFSLQVIGKSRGFIQEAVPDTLKMVGLAEKAQRLPHELSGGEQQRVAIARAIVNKPQILLADEPTGNLDPTTSAGIMTLLERINAGGTTILMATHEAGIVDQMQRRVIELASGQIVRDERQGGYGRTSAIQTITTSTPATGTTAAAVSTAATATQPETSTGPTAISHQATPSQPVASQPGRRAAARTARPDSPTAPPAPPLAVQPTRHQTQAPVAPIPAAHSLFAPPARATEPTPAAAPAPMPTQTHADSRAAAVSEQDSIAADTGMPVIPSSPAARGDEPRSDVQPPTDAVRTMGRPVLPVTQHDVPEQLTLAEKLGLRAPGEKPDHTGEQNVGPTR